MGEPQSVADQVTAPSGSASYSVSQQGVMVMHMATPEWVRRQLIRIDRRGGVMDSAIVAPTGAQQFRHSHRGDRIAFAGDGLAVHDVARDVATKQ